MWKGIDVSDNQGTIDWEAVKKAGCEFAVLRSIRRSGKTDSQFAANLTGCRKQQIPYSVYKYTYAASVQAAKAEASQVVTLLQASGSNCTVWWDVEDRTVLSSLGKENLTAYIQAAQEVIEKAGFSFGIYTGLYVYKEAWFDFSRFTCPLWVARYPSTKEKELKDTPSEQYRPDVGRSIAGWQYSGFGKVPGIKTAVDLDISYLEPASFSGQSAETGTYMLFLSGLTKTQCDAITTMLQDTGITASVSIGISA